MGVIVPSPAEAYFTRSGLLFGRASSYGTRCTTSPDRNHPALLDNCDYQAGQFPCLFQLLRCDACSPSVETAGYVTRHRWADKALATPQERNACGAHAGADDPVREVSTKPRVSRPKNAPRTEPLSRTHPPCPPYGACTVQSSIDS